MKISVTHQRSEPGLSAHDDKNAQNSELYEQESDPEREPENEDDEDKYRHESAAEQTETCGNKRTSKVRCSSARRSDGDDVDDEMTTQPQRQEKNTHKYKLRRRRAEMWETSRD